MKQIKLTRNRSAIVDDSDYTKLSEYKWYCTHNGYAQRDIWKPRSKILMHRYLLKAKKGENIDHINGNPLDNRRKNLRICNQSQNTANGKIRKNNKSGYKGVSYNKKFAKWEAYITKDYKHIFLGYFDKKNDAAKAYNTKAKEVFGKFANLNKL